MKLSILLLSLISTEVVAVEPQRPVSKEKNFKILQVTIILLNKILNFQVGLNARLF